jgi:hypothetical protein
LQRFAAEGRLFVNESNATFQFRCHFGPLSCHSPAAMRHGVHQYLAARPGRVRSLHDDVQPMLFVLDCIYGGGSELQVE